MNVLIADDEPISRRLLESYLGRWGYQVTAAQDGAEAWSMFEQGDYPLVITDWMMPNLDGVELIRRIRARENAGIVYTILLTAKAEKGDLVQGMEAGADDFLCKPFDRDELRVRLREGERIIGLERSLAEREELARLGAAWSQAGPRVAESLDAAAAGLAAVRNRLADGASTGEVLDGIDEAIRGVEEAVRLARNVERQDGAERQAERAGSEV